ncbi:MAG: MATE family efflux transporter [Clostridiales bacterium]|nr:MATE family efflux transporter [Clostridiales bacterium]
MKLNYSPLARATDREILRLAWPCIMESLFATLVGFIDTAMVGSLGAHATAAIGAVSAFTWFNHSLISMVGVGGTAIVARLVGAREMDEAEKISGQVFWMALLLSLFQFVFVQTCAPMVPALLQADPSLHHDSAMYLRCLSFGFLINHTGQSLGGLLRGAGDTKTTMVSGMIANIANMVLNFFMIYESRMITVLGVTIPMWGMGLGVMGAAIASAVANSLAGSFVILRMLGKKARIRLRVCKLSELKFDVWKRVLRIGAPAAVERCAVNVGQMVFSAMISSIGVTAIAAHTLAIQIEGLGYMPAYGFATAATAMVGQRLGAGDRDGASYAGKRAAKLALGLLVLVGIGTFSLSHQLIALFTPDPDVRLVGAMLVRICSFEQPFNAINSVFSGALQGAGDTRKPMVYSFASMWCVRILMAYIFGVLLDLGVGAIWWCMVADLGCRALLFTRRFYKGQWADIKV